MRGEFDIMEHAIIMWISWIDLRCTTKYIEPNSLPFNSMYWTLIIFQSVLCWHKSGMYINVGEIDTIQ